MVGERGSENLCTPHNTESKSHLEPPTESMSCQTSNESAHMLAGRSVLVESMDCSMPPEPTQGFPVVLFTGYLKGLKESEVV